MEQLRMIENELVPVYETKLYTVQSCIRFLGHQVYTVSGQNAA